MCHRSFLKDEILNLLKSNSASLTSWHSEYDLEAFFLAQGYDVDLVQDVVDRLITEGKLEFGTDTHDGDQLVCLATETMPEPERIGAADEL
jgi:hypothetical protein